MQYCYHKIDVKYKHVEPLPPKFIGSSLRGVFGMVLKKSACINPAGRCHNCFAAQNCVYYQFFELKNKIRKFRFIHSLNQPNYNFSLLIFGSAAQYLPYILGIIHKLSTKYGIGRKRVKPPLKSILVNNSEVYNNNTFNLSKISPKIIDQTTLGNHFKTDNLRITFHTPFRIKHHNQLLKQAPELNVILRSVIQRKQSIFHDDYCPQHPQLNYTPDYLTQTTNTQFVDLIRYSSRQRSKMRFGGIIGFIDLKNVDSESLKLLHLGQIIGIGKQTTFGLGNISIDELI